MPSVHDLASVGGLSVAAFGLCGVAEVGEAAASVSVQVEPFDEASARAALEEACASVHLDAGGAYLIRLGENGVFRLQSGAVVARVGRSHAKMPMAKRQIAVARWLAANEVPSIRSLDVNQPVLARGRVVTFWESADEVVRYGSTRELGLILKRLHRLPIPRDADLPTLAPFRTARTRIAAVPISDSDRMYLEDRCAALESAYERLTFSRPDVVLHGDANVGNLILDRDDQALLSDLDSFCIGPREWDLALTAMFYKRFGWHGRAEYDDFVAAYGEDVLQWEGFDVLADVRELLMVAWLAQNAHTEHVALELTKRLDDMRNGKERTDWNPF
jgi:aminoglycoside phosphotransferase